MRTAILSIVLVASVSGCDQSSPVPVESAPGHCDMGSLTIGAVATPSTEPLDLLVGRMGADYRSAGRDNNYLDSTTRDAAGLAALTKDRMTQVLHGAIEVSDALWACLFITEGAYGEHFSPEEAQALASQYTGELLGHEPPLTVTRIEGKNVFDWEIISSPCAVVLSDGSEPAMVLQGFGVD